MRANDKEDKRPYKQGERHGLWEVYWLNGDLCYKGYYINGITLGFWINPKLYKIYYAR